MVDSAYDEATLGPQPGDRPTWYLLSTLLGSAGDA